MEDLLELAKKILNLVVPVLYIVIGFFVLVERQFIIPLESFYAYSLAGVLIVYGIYRVVRNLKAKSNS